MLKILLAESDLQARDSIRGALEHRGIFVECEREGVRAIRLGLVLCPQVLIAGWDLADATRGTDVARSLQGRDASLRVVLVLPPDLESGWEARCGSLAVTAFLRRPVDLPRLREVIALIA